MIKNKTKSIGRFLRSLERNMITVVILILTAMGTIWVYAAFTEPTVGPDSSDQDFSGNIMGANNADNDFDSSLVASNADGSVIEQLEYIINYLGG